MLNVNMNAAVLKMMNHQYFRPTAMNSVKKSTFCSRTTSSTLLLCIFNCRILTSFQQETEITQDLLVTEVEDIVESLRSYP
jgi:hypothetical protein